MLCYLLVGTLFPVSKINIQHQLTCLGLAPHWAALAAPPLLVPLDPLSLVTLHLLQLDDQVLTVLAMDNRNIYSFFMKEMKNIFEKLGAGGYKQVSFYFKNIYSCSSNLCSSLMRCFNFLSLLISEISEIFFISFFKIFFIYYLLVLLCHELELVKQLLLGVLPVTHDRVEETLNHGEIL